MLLAYAWPGNIRELSHAIERSIVLLRNDEIGADDLGLPTGAPERPRIGAEGGDKVDVDFTRGSVELEAIEAELIRKAMAFTEGNQVRAAKLLGLSRDALRYRLDKFGLR
jgi:DNA-binding NtrC family response regulator